MGAARGCDEVPAESVVEDAWDRPGHPLPTLEEAGARSAILGRHELALLRLDPWPEKPGGVQAAEYRAALALYERLQTTTPPD